ncbi:MAG TPA: nucleotidyltransferase family protein [Gemmatimonadaceae bacterium]|nr:nucleotidyltransferase family protein [Gemmatimonadaceae bacterium]
MKKNVSAVILAAGSSTRLGRPKQLVEFEGETLVQRAAAAAKSAGAGSVFVVVGAFADEVRSAVELVNDVTVVLNPNWESGLASSLATGIEVVQAMGCDAALVMTTDQPLIASKCLKALIDAFDAEHRIVAASYDDVIGVPAVFGSDHFRSLMELNGDEGAGRWLRARSGEVKQIRIDGAAVDIDTQADIDRLQSHDSRMT